MGKFKREDSFRGSLIDIKLLSEAGGQLKVPHEVQVLKVGTFYDKRYGRFEITKEMLLSIKKNFDSHVMKIDPAFDYKHDSDDVAAGWFREINLKNNDSELWVLADWTPAGEKKLGEREFRYISADFTLNYIDNETLKEYGPCLRGAALTNRPVIKGMDPVTLTEGEGTNMDEKDKKIAELQQKIAELEKKVQAADKPTDKEEKPEPDGDEGDKGEAMLALKKQLHEANSKNKEISDKLAEYADKEKNADEEKKMSEKKSKFDKLLSEGKAVKSQEEAFMKNDMEKFFELGEKAHLDATGNSGTGVELMNGKDADDQILELAEKRVAEKKSADISEAISRVLAENPKLAATRKR